MREKPATPAANPPQEQSADDQGGFVFKKEVEEVLLHATVVDEHHFPIITLDRDAFVVYEDGVPQPITSFRREDVPVAMGILIDNSGSMRDKRGSVNTAVLNLIRGSNPNDQMFVVNFGIESYLDQDFTADQNLLQQALRRVSIQGSTALYDAIIASAIHLERSSPLEKKILLVVTDGQDNASQETLQEAEYRLEQDKNGPVLYAIGLAGDDPRHSRFKALQSLADNTGGVAFLPRNLDELDSLTRAVARDVRSQYAIGYKPASTHNGSYRAIHVDARARGYRRLTVRTRSGYWTGETVR